MRRLPAVRISKADAAARQMKAAIRLMFQDFDPLAVHTLVGAAATIRSNLVEHRHPERSGDKFAQEANALVPAEYFRIMRKAQNFLKHARDDADAVFDLSSDDTEALAFWAVMNGGELGELSMDESVYQLWYLAAHAPEGASDEEPFRRAIDLFGDLSKMSRGERLKVGRQFLDANF
jgi:hypothetical protein